MPPKRKRAEDSVAPSGSHSRTTRSSTRLANATTATGKSTKKTSNKVAVEGGSGPPDADAIPDGGELRVDKPPRSKKPRNMEAASTESKKGREGSKTAVKSVRTKIDAEQESSVTAMHRKHDEDAMPRKSVSSRNMTPTPTKLPPAAAKALPRLPQAPNTTQESYSSDRSLALFEAYAEEGSSMTIGPEGFEKLCTNAQIPLDGALPLILAWQLEATDMGKITRNEWMKGTASLKITSLPQLSMVVNDIQDLLIADKTAIKKSTNVNKDPYDRTAYHAYSDNRKAAFRKLYMFCFTLAKEEQVRNIDMETSIALWSVLLTRKYPLMQEVLDFITEKGTYKATNKDLWSMMLEFCEMIKPSLEDYETDGAWPTLLDDFVTTKKSNMNNVNSCSDSTAIDS